MSSAEAQRIEVRTSLGATPVLALLDERPRVLCITGMFSPEPEMVRFPHVVGPDFTGILVKLPGHGGPPLAETSVAAFAAAFDELADQLRPSVVVGLSAGALVALSMRHAGLRATVAVDPPFETAKLWMMVEHLGRTFAQHEAFHRNVLGFTPREFSGRCYLDLLEDLRRPTYFVLGDAPLFPVREVADSPSLVDEPTRRLIATKPLARLRVAKGAGHLIRRDAGYFLLDVIREACAEAHPS